MNVNSFQGKLNIIENKNFGNHVINSVDESIPQIPPAHICSWILLENLYAIELENGSILETECQMEPAMISFTLTLTGPWAANHTITCQYQAIANQVTLYFPALSAGATSVAEITSTSGIPGPILPISNLFMSGIPVINNSIDVDGSIEINSTTGIVTMGLNVIGLGESNEFQAFQNAGQAGFNSFCITYLT